MWNKFSQSKPVSSREFVTLDKDGVTSTFSARKEFAIHTSGRVIKWDLLIRSDGRWAYLPDDVVPYWQRDQIESPETEF